MSENDIKDLFEEMKVYGKRKRFIELKDSVNDK